MSGKYAPLLRHAATGIALPFLDTRVVPKQTLMEYLGCDSGRFDALFAKGLLTPPGGFVETGDTRPQISYVPAVIWAANRWVPSDAVLRILSASGPELVEQIAATRRVLDEVTRLLRPAA